MLPNTRKTFDVLPMIFASSATLTKIYSFYSVYPTQNSQIIPLEDTSDNLLSSAIHSGYIDGSSLITDRSCVESEGVNFDAIIIDAFV